MPQSPQPLPTKRAFVVQLRAQLPGAPLAWDGRVEHVVCAAFGAAALLAGCATKDWLRQMAGEQATPAGGAPSRG